MGGGFAGSNRGGCRLSGIRAEIVSATVTVYHDGTATWSAIGSAIQGAGLQVVETSDPEVRRTLPTILVAISGMTTGLGLLLQWMKVEPDWLSDFS